MAGPIGEIGRIQRAHADVPGQRNIRIELGDGHADAGRCGVQARLRLTNVRAPFARARTEPPRPRLRDLRQGLGLAQLIVHSPRRFAGEHAEGVHRLLDLAIVSRQLPARVIELRPCLIHVELGGQPVLLAPPRQFEIVLRRFDVLLLARLQGLRSAQLHVGLDDLALQQDQCIIERFDCASA